MNVAIYTTPAWGYCHQAKRFLSERGISFTEYDVSRDRVAAGEMVRLTGQMGVPVIIVDGQTVLGFDRARLTQLLERTASAKPRLGLKVADADKYSNYQGAYIAAVATGSPAERAGFRQGDVIVSIDTKKVARAADLESIWTHTPLGQRAIIVFIRDEKARQTEITT